MRPRFLGGIVAGISFLAAVLAVVGVAHGLGHNSARDTTGQPDAGAPGTRATARPVADAVLPSHPTPCSASQLILDAATHSPGFATEGDQSEYVTQPLHNVGPTCMLSLPQNVVAANATGPFQAIVVLNAGHAASYRIPHGTTVSIVLGAWWPIPRLSQHPDPASRPCSQAIANVSRLEIPLGSSDVQVQLGEVWPEVCTSQASVSITMKS